MKFTKNSRKSPSGTAKGWKVSLEKTKKRVLFVEETQSDEINALELAGEFDELSVLSNFSSTSGALLYYSLGILSFIQIR